MTLFTVSNSGFHKMAYIKRAPGMPIALFSHIAMQRYSTLPVQPVKHFSTHIFRPRLSFPSSLVTASILRDPLTVEDSRGFLPDR